MDILIAAVDNISCRLFHNRRATCQVWHIWSSCWVADLHWLFRIVSVHMCIESLHICNNCFCIWFGCVYSPPFAGCSLDTVLSRLETTCCHAAHVRTLCYCVGYCCASDWKYNEVMAQPYWTAVHWWLGGLWTKWASYTGVLTYLGATITQLHFITCRIVIVLTIGTV